MSLQLQQQTAPQIIESKEENNKFFLKAFLLDSSIARNDMGVVSEYLPKHINKFVGTPVILTEDFYHPHSFEHYVGTGVADKDVPELKKLQLPYSIGTIVSVDSNTNNVTQGGQENNNIRYSALLEITDPKAVAAFKNGKIPMYVSPSIYRVNSNESFSAITDYEPLHIAIVDNPAYGFHKANIRSQCQGDITHCTRMLAQASNNDNGLNYCVEKKLNELNNVFSGSNSSSSYSKTSSLDKIVTLQEDNNAVQTTSESQTQQVEQQPTIEQKIQEEQKKAAELKQSKTPINTPAPQKQQQQQSVPEPENINPPGTEEQREEPEDVDETPCAKAAEELNRKIALYDSKIKEFDDFKANLVKEAKESKVQAKRNKIENVVPANYADSEEERKKAVESLMNVADDQLDIILNSFVIPATKNIKQGGMRQNRPKVTDFVKEENKVAQASMKIDSRALENLESVLSFAGTIVPKKNNNTGGIA